MGHRWAIGLVVLLVLLGTILWASLGAARTTEGGAAVVLSAPDRSEAVLAADDASPPGNAPDRPGGAFGYTRYVFEKLGDEVLTTLVEGPRGEQVRVSISYEQLKALRQGGGVPEKLRMTEEELGTLVGQLDTVRASTARYRNFQAAVDDGFFQITDEVPNMGAHLINVRRSLDGVFDPAEPEVLLYARDASGEWELVGVSFVLPSEQFGSDHPDAFAGPLDNWHVHYNVCTGPSITSRSATLEECRKQGGIWAPSFGWMIHAWVWVDNPLGVFSMWNPDVPPLVDAEDIERSRRPALSDGDAQTTPIVNFSFETAQVQAGGSLAWTNVDGVPHTVTAGERGVASGGFDSGLIAPGQSFVVRFDQPGEYSFTCSLHPFMTGTVIVIP